MMFHWPLQCKYSYYFAVRAEIVHDQSTKASVGASYRLTCSISGYDKLQQFSIAYQWFKNGILYKEDMTSAILNFNSLTFDDHGAYSCRYFFTPHEQARVVNGTSPLFVLDFNGMFFLFLELLWETNLSSFHANILSHYHLTHCFYSAFHHHQVWAVFHTKKK